MKRKEVESCTILLTLTGSRLYGIDNPESDYDYKGICIPPFQYFFGDSNFDQLDSFVDPDCLYPVLTNTDSQIYNLKKYVHLALLNNPNILELLWVASEHYVVKTQLADRLIALRELFLSTKVYHSYSGYAYAQIKRVKTHRGWLQAYHANTDFFNTPPNPKDYGLEDNPLRKEQLNAFLEFLYILIDDAAQYHSIRDEIFAHIDFKSVLKQYKIKPELLDAVQYYTRSTDEFMTLLHNTQRYRQAKQEYDAFHSWKANRNSKRAAIEEKCGMDAKHAGHAYRLLKSGIEILNGQGVIPDRRVAGDADYIRSIRNGEVEYDTLMQQVDGLMLDLETAKNNTKLPRTPDRQTIEEEVVSMIKDYLL
jgi:hypothetical protein